MVESLISFSDSDEQVQEESALSLYATISEFIGESLDPSRDSIVISKPIVRSRSADNHILLLTIKNERVLALKRCYDSPEFLRRELVIAEARRVFGFPSYLVARKHGLVLLNKNGKGNCVLVRGWEEKDIIFIDFGRVGDSKNLAQLVAESIVDMSSFLFQFGMWAAFNYLLVVRDRHPGNFVYVKSQGVILSVDNEEGPFDSQGRSMNPQDIILQMKEYLRRILPPTNKEKLVSAFKSGFEIGWTTIDQRIANLKSLSQIEMQLTLRLLKQDFRLICNSFIN